MGQSPLNRPSAFKDLKPRSGDLKQSDLKQSDLKRSDLKRSDLRQSDKVKGKRR
ncbi:MAG: pentapeptide repeat-containing protein [Kiritimatiellae bacterium]|nr:pentapeptide repeat-containing protein [Kiritimatiellia bacterium]